MFAAGWHGWRACILRKKKEKKKKKISAAVAENMLLSVESEVCLPLLDLTAREREAEVRRGKFSRE